MDNLYHFITAICKSRGMKLEDMQRKLGFSRSTLYRYMKGINAVTQEVKEKFIDALNLDAMEQAEFSRLASVSSYADSLIKSRYAIDEFVFGPKKTQAPPDFDVVLYDGDRFLRKFSEILELIASYADRDGFVGDMKLVNCVNQRVFSHIGGFLERMLSSDAVFKAEHLVCFSEQDYHQNVKAFIDIISLIKYERYHLLYSETDFNRTLFRDYILVSVQYRENEKQCGRYYAISFTEHGMPECAAFSDPHMLAFLLNSFADLKQSFKDIVHSFDQVDIENDLLTELESRKVCYIMKPNPCYNKIPYAVFQSIGARMEQNGQMGDFLSSMLAKEMDAESMPLVLDKAFQYMKKRADYSLRNTHIDVHSENGMIEMAMTGRLSDHLVFMPSFNKEEIKAVLENIAARNQDPADDYTLYVAESDFVNDEYTLFVYKDFGVAVEYVIPPDRQGVFRFLVVESKRLASIFCDYFENHFPNHHAMPKERADAFMASLIENL